MEQVDQQAVVTSPSGESRARTSVECDPRARRNPSWLWCIVGPDYRGRDIRWRRLLTGARHASAACREIRSDSRGKPRPCVPTPSVEGPSRDPSWTPNRPDRSCCFFSWRGLCAQAPAPRTFLFVAKEPSSRIDLAVPEVPVPKAPKIARNAVPEPVVEDAAQAQDHAPAVIKPQEPSTAASRPAVVPVAPLSETQQPSMVQGMVMKNGLPAQGFEVVLAAAEAEVPGGVGRTAGAGGNGAQGELRWSSTHRGTSRSRRCRPAVINSRCGGQAAADPGGSMRRRSSSREARRSTSPSRSRWAT